MTLLQLFPSLGAAARPRFDHRAWPKTLRCDEDGKPAVGGMRLVDLADQFGTPCDLIDEMEVRGHARAYRAALPKEEIAYSTRALFTPAIAGWLEQEGLSLDVSSEGELQTALAAGFPTSRIIAGGAVKTRAELEAAVRARVGRISVDTLGELSYLAAGVDRPQQVLLRVGLSDDLEQAFGFPLTGGGRSACTAGGLAEEAWLKAAGHRMIRVVGLHCHVGTGSHEQALGTLLDFLRVMRHRHGLTVTQINLGGGLSAGDCAALALLLAQEPTLRLTLEPGQGVVGQAGVRLARVIATSFGSSGELRVHIDGAIPVESAVACLVNRHSLAADVPARLLSRACGASGRATERHAPADTALTPLPADLRAGDLIAFPGIGAYSHTQLGTAGALVGVRDGIPSRL